MDKTAIKTFAVWARKKLITDIEQKAYEIGITASEIRDPVFTASDTMIVGNRSLNRTEIVQRESLVARIREKGFHSVVEETAYTWFNRIIALRFMEINEYLPTGVRILSSIEPDRKEPDIIRDALNTNLVLDRERVYALQDKNDTDSLYRYLLVKQCNALNAVLPGLFEKIEDYTEILLPSNLLAEGSVIRQLIEDIPEEDFRDQVEIIGWMYQYYISEKKDEVFVGLKKNIKITKENIPAATQLFTPEWIVKYMVENSLGRLWLEGHANDELKTNWKYYVEEAEQEAEVLKQLEEIRAENRNIKPEDIKLLDPAMGSGHILVYAFDVFYDIYQSAGYFERDIPKLILENNLYGLDIDDRAAQLAYFAVMMKARSKNRRIFREKINVNLCSIQESNGFPKEAMEYLINWKETEVEKQLHRKDVEYLIKVFHDAREYGSILEVASVDFDTIEKRLDEIENGEIQDITELLYRNIILDKIPGLIKQARMLSRKYDVVCTNPPYMSSRGMNGKLAEFMKNTYPDSKSDLFAAFMEVPYIKHNGLLAMINQHSWMFLSSYEKLRDKLILTRTILNMIHLGPRAFEEIAGEVVQSTAFVLKNNHMNQYRSTFIRLVDVKDAKRKESTMLAAKVNTHPLHYIAVSDQLKDMPGQPVVYWIRDSMRLVFEKGIALEKLSEPRQGLATGDNKKYLRLWYEVDRNLIGLGKKNIDDFHHSQMKYAPYNKGGDYRKWYGNRENVIKFDMENYHKLLNVGNRLPSRQYYFRQSITWSFVSTTSFAVRYSSTGSVFDVGGSSIFPPDDHVLYLTALMCSKISTELMNILNPTMNYQVGDVKRIPVIISKEYEPIINELAKQNISISRLDWDSFETSWDFTTHPLLRHKGNSSTIEQAFQNWSAFAESQFRQLKANEEELNRIFIEIYGLQDELTPEVEDKNVTLRRADRGRDIKSLISYAVGCMLGRYAVDEEGLIYAGGVFRDKWGCEDGHIRFVPDIDNILPITDDEYFEDDIVSRFAEFLTVTFGEDTLAENLDYIADTLGKKPSETARQAIRRYFLKDFYQDHVKVYQKRPIYWLFDSGRQVGLKALIYMHRYDEFTIARLRTDYLHRLQKSYEAEIKSLNMTINSNASQREKTMARKKKETMIKQMDECMQYDQIVAHVANQRIRIDLDDGVKVNYEKFQGIEIPQGEGRRPLKSDLLAKI